MTTGPNIILQRTKDRDKNNRTVNAIPLQLEIIRQTERNLRYAPTHFTPACDSIIGRVYIFLYRKFAHNFISSFFMPTCYTYIIILNTLLYERSQHCYRFVFTVRFDFGSPFVRSVDADKAISSQLQNILQEKKKF